ncbi:MAG: hypothetical protein JSU85_13555 [Candidatus Zixiibacteriota bacterium]|nr:MAG: hypothetical protein JSU85_13555 [candidate division Zixibacteria bacterium]
MKIINHLIFLTISFSMVLLYNCSREKTTSNNAGIDDIAHQDLQSDCLNRPDTPDPAFGHMVLEAQGNDLHIRHIDSYYQCCLLYTVKYSIDNFDITASESDTGSLCDCYCHFNLKSIVYDLKSGLYNVALIGIRGDTVGIDTITVGG